MLGKPIFEIHARAGSARAGVVHLEYGDLHTPAFVPLASTATVKGLHSAEVAELGYEMVLGNTFHLFIQPGHDHIAKLGGLHEFMSWRRPIITDSGGFQVFSMGHGSVADEIKRRRPGADRILSIDEEGVRFRSYLDGSERFMGPETSMEIQAALGSDIALAFDECTPVHVDRDYTARSTERTHRWLDRCISWHERHSPGRQAFFGIIQGGVHEDLRAQSAERIASSQVDGIAVGGSLGQEKAEMHEVVGWSLQPVPERLPRHLLGIGDVDDIVHAVRAGIDMFDCATPTRLGRHGTALVQDPGARWRMDLTRPAYREDVRPIDERCPCPACRDHTRAYLHYLSRAKEITSARLVTLHNLTFMKLLMNGIRAALVEGRFEEHSRRVLAGEEPFAG